MKETSKGHPSRLAGDHYRKYLHGNIIDIGAGDDPLRIPEGTGNVFAFDKQHGDAQLMPGLLEDAYDAAYSSHCLEHMRDVPEALKNWARIVKPGGHLYIVVPDYVRYEHLRFPSRFNADHKQSFSLEISRKEVKRDNHWDLIDMQDVTQDIGLTLSFFELQDEGFNYNAGDVDQTLAGALAQILFVFRKPKTAAA